MPKEYRTIQEVAGPRCWCRAWKNVTYDELGEIELASGEKRRCKVLEIDGGNALVQLLRVPRVSTFQIVRCVFGQNDGTWRIGGYAGTRL